MKQILLQIVTPAGDYALVVTCNKDQQEFLADIERRWNDAHPYHAQPSINLTELE